MKTDRHLSRLRAPELGLGLRLGLSGPSAGGGRTSGMPWALPIVFTQAGYFPVQVSSGPKVGTGSFTTNYDEANFRHYGTPYYVSSTGNDADDGLSTSTAKRTLQAAHDAAADNSVINVGGGVFANFANTKNLTVIGAGRANTFIGAFLQESDVSIWGSLSSGRQMVTLSSGRIEGFCDLTRTRRADYQGVPIPQVSYDAATAAGIATLQATTTTIHDQQLYGTAIGTADPVAGINRASPSTIGASDSRNMQGEFGSTILAWNATAPAPVTITGSKTLFMKNLSLVGGAAITPPAGATLVMHDCWRLGGVSDIFFVNGRLISYRGGARGCGISGADIYDYEGNAVGVEIDIYTDQCGGTGADNNSTGHTSMILRVNGLHRDASRCINDINGSISGDFGLTLGSSRGSGAYTFASGGGGDCHTAGLRLLDKGSGYDYMLCESGSFLNAHAYVYDNWIDTYVQGPPTAGSSIAKTDRTGNRPTDDRTFFKIDPSNKANLFTDAAGTTAVTAVGQEVRRVRDPNDPTQYVDIAAGKFTYQEDGAGRGLLRTAAGTNIGAFALMMTGDAFDENTTIIYAIKSTDTSCILMHARSGNANYIGRLGDTDFKSATTVPAGFSTPDYTIHVDGSDTALATSAAVKSAAFNGAKHLITVRNANISWIAWLRSLAILNQFDGDVYGIEFFRTTTAAARQVREAAMAV